MTRDASLTSTACLYFALVRTSLVSNINTIRPIWLHVLTGQWQSLCRRPGESTQRHSERFLGKFALSLQLQTLREPRFEACEQEPERSHRAGTFGHWRAPADAKVYPETAILRGVRGHVHIRVVCKRAGHSKLPGRAQIFSLPI